MIWSSEKSAGAVARKRKSLVEFTRRRTWARKVTPNDRPSKTLHRVYELTANEAWVLRSAERCFEHRLQQATAQPHALAGFLVKLPLPEEAKHGKGVKEP